MVEACEAEVVTMTGCKHSFMREEGEGVGVNELADLLNAVLVAYKFLWRMFVLTKVLPNIYQHRLAPHKEEILYCAMVANDEIIYNLLICHANYAFETKLLISL